MEFMWSTNIYNRNYIIFLTWKIGAHNLERSQKNILVMIMS